MKFVIQEYRLSNGGIRYYLRLEKDGVLKGWAVPKGLPEKGDRQRLALEVGPFKLSAAGYEGKVAKSKFGPGMISVWDQGEYRLDSWIENRIIFELFGSRMKGSFALIRFTKAGSFHWLLSRPHSSPSASPSIKKPETAIKTPEKSPAVPPRRRAPAIRPTVGTKKVPEKDSPAPTRPKSISSQSKPKPNQRPIQRSGPTPKYIKSKAPKQRPKKYNSHYRRKGKTANWLNKNRHTRDGRMLGWIIMGAVIMIIYGLVKLIQYIGSRY
ncbi:MAG: DNA polymerase ligase N-terminal domain-containing protein [Candidatus Auribacterota bacterium]|nr:DNA polymerase ligase N-terminal domain-containing protein [Candidatus Auribacterota bacterium]